MVRVLTSFLMKGSSVMTGAPSASVLAVPGTGIGKKKTLPTASLTDLMRWSIEACQSCALSVGVLSGGASMAGPSWRADSWAGTGERRNPATARATRVRRRR